MKKVLFLFLLATLTVHAAAQRVAVTTNVVDWVYLGTVNLETSLAVSQHVSVSLGGKINPWEFHSSDPDLLVSNQMKAVSVGTRYWPWYVFSGWWTGLKGQYQQFSRTGIWRPALEVGKAVGVGISTGYSLMLNKHLNVEFGAGFWGGSFIERTLYCCPECMDIRESGPAGFFRPDNIIISMSYVF